MLHQQAGTVDLDLYVGEETATLRTTAVLLLYENRFARARVRVCVAISLILDASLRQPTALHFPVKAGASAGVTQ